MNSSKIILLLALVMLLIGVAAAGEVSEDTTTKSMNTIVQKSQATTNTTDEIINEEKTESINKTDKKNIKKMEIDENSPENKEFERYYKAMTTSTKKEVTFNLTSDITLYNTAILNENIKKLNINGNNKTINGNKYHQFLVIKHECTVTINNIKIINCYSEDNGGCIYNRGKLTITNSTLNNNKADRFGGAIFSSEKIIVKNSKLNNNKAEYGGAIFLKGSKNNINNNTFSNNNALVGGAIFNANNNTIIKNNTFSKNTVSGKKLDEDFWSPYISGNGGAIANGGVTYEIKYSSYGNYYIPTYLLTSDINITKNQFINNTGESGGAISILGGTNININQNKFQDNTAQEEGSAIYDEKHEYEEYRYSANGSPIGSVTISIGTNINIINNTFTTNKANATGKTIKSNANIIANNNIKTDDVEYPSTIYTKTEESKITNNIFNKDMKNTKTTVQTTSGIIGEKLSLKATVIDSSNKKVNEGNLIFKLNGITIKDNGKLTGSSNPLKVKVVNGVATATVIPDLDMRNANKLTAKYVGTGKYNASESKQVKIQISQRNATIVVSSNVKTIKQGKVLTLTAKVYDTTNGKRSTKLTKFNEEFVYFKVNSITLKNSNGSMQKVKIVNGTATIKYTIPLGLSGVTDGKTFTVKNHTILAGFYNKNYKENIRNTNTFQVERSNITITISNATVNKKTYKLSLTATIKDYLGNKVVGPNKCIIKINGVTLKNATKPIYYFASYGILKIKNINIPSYNKYTNIEIVTQDRLAYKNQRNTTNVIKVVK